MAHAEKCPICNGSGKIPAFYNYDVNYVGDCHGCEGKGWVEVSDSEQVEAYIPQTTDGQR